MIEISKHDILLLTASRASQKALSEVRVTLTFKFYAEGLCELPMAKDFNCFLPRFCVINTVNVVASV